MNNRAVVAIKTADLPAVSFGVSAEVYSSLQQHYDLFTRTDVDNEAILDALAFDEEDMQELAKLVGADAAEECQGQYVLFYVAD